MYANTGVYNHPFVPQFQEYSRKGISFKYTDEDIKIIVASNYITGAARRPAVGFFYCDDNYCFLYMLLQSFAMHEPRLQAPSDYISDVFDSLDPWPQQYSCSFRFKWLELIVPWGSSVIYRPGTLLLLLLLLVLNCVLWSGSGWFLVWSMNISHVYVIWCDRAIGCALVQ